jgi:hypothetical protein
VPTATLSRRRRRSLSDRRQWTGSVSGGERREIILLFFFFIPWKLTDTRREETNDTEVFEEVVVEWKWIKY